MAERLNNNAMYAIPDDPEHSSYRFIIVAAKRARQLQNGARPFLPTTSKKSTVTSMEEVRRGLVKYWQHVPPKMWWTISDILASVKGNHGAKDPKALWKKLMAGPVNESGLFLFTVGLDWGPRLFPRG